MSTWRVDHVDLVTPLQHAPLPHAKVRLCRGDKISRYRVTYCPETFNCVSIKQTVQAKGGRYATYRDHSHGSRYVALRNLITPALKHASEQGGLA